MPQASVFPFPNLVDLLSFDRIPVNILEDHQELRKGPDDPREEPLPPDMADIPMDSVVRHGEYAQDPLQDAGKGFSAARSDHDVEVVAHEGEVLYAEIVPLPGPGDDLKEELFHAPVVQDHLLPIRPGGDVIEGPVL